MTDAVPGTLLFGDLLARARQQWVRQMADQLARLGFSQYRRSDAIAMRVLYRRSHSLGELSKRLGVSRQVARQVADGLFKRGYVVLVRAGGDRRRVEVHITPVGVRYAEAVISVITTMNARITNSVDSSTLDAARSVLQAVIDGSSEAL